MIKLFKWKKKSNVIERKRTFNQKNQKYLIRKCKKDCKLKNLGAISFEHFEKDNPKTSSTYEKEKYIKIQSVKQLVISKSIQIQIRVISLLKQIQMLIKLQLKQIQIAVISMSNGLQYKCKRYIVWLLQIVVLPYVEKEG